MHCIVCATASWEIGSVCATCHARVSACPGLLPQQILANIATPTEDVLVDQWGRAHPLESSTMIGRALAGSGILLVEVSVSRHHAHLMQVDGAWQVRDLNSANGTFINGEQLAAVATLRHGDTISIGAVPFILACRVRELSSVPLDPAGFDTLELTRRPSVRLASVAPLRSDENDDGDLPRVPLWIVEPTAGASALLHIADTTVQLSPIQAELLEMFSRRMLHESHQPAEVRGFVRASELSNVLAFDSLEPDESHVKQLIRRTRRILEREGLDHVIESRKGFGYRLRLIPMPKQRDEVKRSRPEWASYVA